VLNVLSPEALASWPIAMLPLKGPPALLAVLPIAMLALKMPPAALVKGPIAMLLETPLAWALTPIAMFWAPSPVAVALPPIAMFAAPLPLALGGPAPGPTVPIAMLKPPLALAPDPKAVALPPLAFAPVPHATEFGPAAAPSPPPGMMLSHTNCAAAGCERKRLEALSAVDNRRRCSKRFPGSGNRAALADKGRRNRVSLCEHPAGNVVLWFPRMVFMAASVVAPSRRGHAFPRGTTAEPRGPAAEPTEILLQL
jgi:hypothetical protein